MAEQFKKILVNSIKFKKIQENSFILTFIGRIFVRIELVISKKAGPIGGRK